MWFGCVDFAIAGDEEIGASAFGYKAAFVGEEGVGTFFHALSLEIGNLIGRCGCDFWLWGRCTGRVRIAGA